MRTGNGCDNKSGENGELHIEIGAEEAVYLERGQADEARKRWSERWRNEDEFAPHL
jgi:hypothetical protein